MAWQGSWSKTHHLDGQGGRGKEPEGGSQDGETHCDSLEYSARKEEEDGCQNEKGKWQLFKPESWGSTEHSAPGQWFYKIH